MPPGILNLSTLPIITTTLFPPNLGLYLHTTALLLTALPPVDLDASYLSRFTTSHKYHCIEQKQHFHPTLSSQALKTHNSYRPNI